MKPLFDSMLKRLNVSTLAGMALLVFAGFQSAAAQPAAHQIDGTTGAPLGGIGAGAIKFCSHNGSFTGTWRTPCALDDFSLLPSTQFQLFTQVGSAAPVTNTKLSAVITGDRADDDAVYPVQRANFGTINGVKVNLSAFSPWDLSNPKEIPTLMCYPYAFFQMQVTNTSGQPATVAVALQASFSSAATYVSGKGIKNDGATLKRAIYATSNDPAAVISAGNDNGFLTNGQCNNAPSGNINKVAVKVSLAANETKLIKFVYAWHNDVKGYEGQKDGMFYYLGKVTLAMGAAGAVADTGLIHFNKMRDNAISFVDRVRASNLPDWLKNQNLVTLCNLTNNSMFRQDGRYAHTEGQWSTNGTNDQMFHSRYIYANLLPSMNWQELQYWARTQKTNPMGQIHHDIDSCSDAADYAMSRNMAYMCPWDATQHQDYRDIDKWVDLNAVYILSVYEAYIQTGDTAKLSYFWPSANKAGKRMIDQLTQDNRGSEKYPYLYSKGTQNTYDADGSNDMSAYNNSIAIPTFKALSIMAEIKNDAAAKSLYSKYHDSMRVGFQKYYFTALNFPQLRTENIMTGPWESFFVKFGEMMDSSKLVWGLGELKKKYNPAVSGLGYESGTYSEWSEYLVGHYGGVSLQTGYFNEWYGLQFDWYQRIFSNRNLVYNTELGIPAKVAKPNYSAASSSGFNQYISAPVIWRLYYTITGYFRNKHSNELWLEPTLPSTLTTMNHSLINAVVFSPEGPATISFRESGTGYKVQDIMFKPDNPIMVTNLYVKDRGLGTNIIKINGTAIANATITKAGTGFAKVLKIPYNQTIGSNGISITVSDDPAFISSFTSIRRKNNTAKSMRLPVFSASPGSFSIATISGQPYVISITALNGKTLKRYEGFGEKTFRFVTSAQSSGVSLPKGVYFAKVQINNALYPERFMLCQ